MKGYESDDGNIKIASPVEINLHLWTSYNLGFATVGVDFGFEYIGKGTWEDGNTNTSGDLATYDTVRVGFGAWLKKTYGNGSIKGGLAYRLGTADDKGTEPGVFSIPIVFDYSF